jgi:hypothetical protein
MLIKELIDRNWISHGDGNFTKEIKGEKWLFESTMNNFSCIVEGSCSELVCEGTLEELINIENGEYSSIEF